MIHRTRILFSQIVSTFESIRLGVMFMSRRAVANRRGELVIAEFQKLLTMLPTEEEKNRIIEAQMANSDIPLGNAEQFLLTLTSIVELEARLKLWIFKLDFDNIELVREILSRRSDRTR